MESFSYGGFELIGSVLVSWERDEMKRRRRKLESGAWQTPPRVSFLFGPFFLNGINFIQQSKAPAEYKAENKKQSSGPPRPPMQRNSARE